MEPQKNIFYNIFTRNTRDSLAICAYCNKKTPRKRLRSVLQPLYIVFPLHGILTCEMLQNDMNHRCVF